MLVPAHLGTGTTYLLTPRKVAHSFTIRYNHTMKISEMGEWKLIDLVSQLVQEERQRVFHWGSQKELVIGIGDDAAVWAVNGADILLTTDTMVRGVHFQKEYASWQEVGWKVLAVNISDIAAMGGVPNYCLVTLGMPPETEVEGIRELYRGTMDAARPFRVSIVGGDMVTSPVEFITITLAGVATRVDGENTVLTRSAAKIGNLIAVTGYLGGSAGGLRMLNQRLNFAPDTQFYLRDAHLRPKPRVVEGQLLVQNGVRAAIDISDGLLSDLWQICQKSGVGARIYQNQVPTYSLLQAAFPKEYLNLALTGGEDYELLFTLDASLVDRVKARLKIPVTVIGEITKEPVGEVVVLDDKGKEIPYKKRGWSHF